MGKTVKSGWLAREKIGGSYILCFFFKVSQLLKAQLVFFLCVVYGLLSAHVIEKNLSLTLLGRKTELLLPDHFAAAAVATPTPTQTRLGLLMAALENLQLQQAHVVDLPLELCQDTDDADDSVVAFCLDSTDEGVVYVVTRSASVQCLEQHGRKVCVAFCCCWKLMQVVCMLLVCLRRLKQHGARLFAGGSSCGAVTAGGGRSDLPLAYMCDTAAAGTLQYTCTFLTPHFLQPHTLPLPLAC